MRQTHRTISCGMNDDEKKRTGIVDGQSGKLYYEQRRYSITLQWKNKHTKTGNLEQKFKAPRSLLYSLTLKWDSSLFDRWWTLFFSILLSNVLFGWTLNAIHPQLNRLGLHITVLFTLERAHFIYYFVGYFTKYLPWIVFCMWMHKLKWFFPHFFLRSVVSNCQISIQFCSISSYTNENFAHARKKKQTSKLYSFFFHPDLCFHFRFVVYLLLFLPRRLQLCRTHTPHLNARIFAIEMNFPYIFFSV